MLLLPAARLGLCSALLLSLLGCGGPSSSGPEPAGPTLPGLPVRMTLPRLGGGSLSLESLRGRPVLLTLFTTWWVPCQVEAPVFVRLDERFRSRRLALVGIALDSAGTIPVKLVSIYVEEAGFRFPVLLAAPDDLELVGGLGTTKAVPRTVLLDRQGRVVMDQVGVTRFEALEKKILELLSRPASP